MKKVFAYKFKSPLTIEQIFERLRDLGVWRWLERDKDAWGFYVSAAPVPDAAQVKILVDPDDHAWFAVNVSFKSEKPTAQSQFDDLRQTLFARILPAIGATSLTETDDYE